MKNVTLVIMAAGIGSRYGGGIKQLDVQMRKDDSNKKGTYAFAKSARPLLLLTLLIAHIFSHLKYANKK